MDNITTLLKRQWSLSLRDGLISLFYAIIVPVLLQIQSVLDSGTLHFNWVLMAQVALSAAVSHALRKLTERSKVLTVQHIDKDQIPLAEYEVAKANKEKETPPPIGDPTHPRVFATGGDDDDDGDGNIPPIGDPTHPPKK